MNEPDITDYWIRPAGNSLEFSKLKKLDSLSLSDQLFAAVLRKDRIGALEILSKHGNPLLISEFLRRVSVITFGGLICEHIFQMDLKNEIDQIISIEGLQTTKVLREKASVEMTNYARHDQFFSAVLHALEHLSNKAIWLKGAVLSRTLYEMPEHRLSGDFDCLLRREDISTASRRLVAKFNYSPRLDDPGFCNQIGVGPLHTIEDLFTVPAAGLLPCAVFALTHSDLPAIDIKADPFDRGLQMVELERFYDQALNISWRGQTFLAPQWSDHLMLCLTNLEKDRFQYWKTLFDVHLLCQKLNETPDEWAIFVKRCHLEGINQIAWAGLFLTTDRLHSPVPNEVLHELLPVRQGLFNRTYNFTASPSFVWNASSLPMLLLNAYVSSDKQRKLQLLKKAILPSNQFLHAYYALNGSEDSFLKLLFYRILHFFVLVLPGGVVRRTFGPLIWKNSDKSVF